MNQKVNSYLSDVYLTPELMEVFESFSRRDFQKTYLFVGSALSDKKGAALKVAAVLNCPLGGCGSCDSCKKVLKGVHPDVLWLSPEGNEILIDQVRVLREAVELAPFEGRVKVVLIEQAEKFNQESGNAMLKILEEPPPSVVFLLLAEDETQVLPTIRSRAEVLRFPDVPLPLLIERLEREGIERKEAQLVLGFRCSFEEALAYCRESRVRKLREIALRTLVDLPLLKPVEILNRAKKMVSLIEELKGEIKNKQKEELDQWKELLKEKTSYLRWLEKKHKRELRKTEFKLVNSILLDLSFFVRDAIVILNGSNNLINADFRDDIESLACLTGKEKLERMQKRVGEFRKFIQGNVDWKLSLELLYLILKEDFKDETNIRSIFS